MRQQSQQLQRYGQRGSRSVGPLVLATVLLGATPALAWGPLGHELAGELTEQRLSATARQRVRELLGDEPLAEASHWADRMRSDPAPFWQREAGPYHYVTVPPGRRYRDVGAPRKGDAYQALAMFEKELRAASTPLPRRRLALRFALHIIQDLHQPLHVGNGADRGGNDIRVELDGDRSNLHRVWDSVIAESAGRNHGAWLAAMTRGGGLDEPTATDTDPLTWIAESAALRDTLYPPPATVDSAYLRQHLPTVERRLVLAGARGAAWLNKVLADSPPVEGAREAPTSWWRRLLDRFGV